MTDLVAPLTGPYFPLTSSATPGTPRERPWRRAPEQPVTLHPQSRLCPVAVGRGASCSRQATGRLLATLLAAPVSRKWPLSSVTGSGSLNDSALGLMVPETPRKRHHSKALDGATQRRDTAGPASAVGGATWEPTRGHWPDAALPSHQKGPSPPLRGQRDSGVGRVPCDTEQRRHRVGPGERDARTRGRAHTGCGRGGDVLQARGPPTGGRVGSKDGTHETASPNNPLTIRQSRFWA